MTGFRSKRAKVPVARVTGTARHGRLRRSRPWGALAALIATVLAVILVSTGGVAALAVGSILGHLEAPSQGIRIHSKIPAPPTIGAYPGGFNILIVGSDTRVGQNGIGGTSDTSILNDVTMLLHVSGDHTNATAISFPRDMIVPIAACSHGGGVQAPVNTSLFYGGSTDKAPGAGLPCAVSTIEQFTGLTIQFAGLITFKGVVEVTDAVGGVPVCVDGNINDPNTGIHLKSGTHVLKGLTALEFLRTRHGVGDGSDLGRISSQQVYLSALVRKIQSDGTLSNPSTLFAIADAATRNMELSQGFNSPDTLFAIAQALKNIPLNRIVFTQYPGTTAGSGIYSGKVQPLLGPGNQLLALLKSDTPFTLGTDNQDLGSVKGTAPHTPKSTATPTPTPTSTGKAGAKKPQVLNNVPGQPADEYTCSKAFGQ